MCILPVRCYTCGKITGGKWESYRSFLSDGVEPAKALDILGLKRMCCRRMMMGHVELIDNLLKYSQPTQNGSPLEMLS